MHNLVKIEGFSIWQDECKVLYPLQVSIPILTQFFKKCAHCKKLWSFLPWDFDKCIDRIEGYFVKNWDLFGDVFTIQVIRVNNSRLNHKEIAWIKKSFEKMLSFSYSVEWVSDSNPFTFLPSTMTNITIMTSFQCIF